MCSSELECLQNIATNILHIKAFCYALSVSLAIGFFVYVYNRFIGSIIGGRY